MRKEPLLFMVVMFALVSVTLASAQDSDGLDRTFPKPLPEHPGNVFLAGEEVVVPLPGDWTGAWRVLDYDGRQLAEGNGPGKISLGKLPVGYYEIPLEDGKPPIGIGVLAPLAAPTPKTSPIGVDASVPWSLGNKLPEAANLCALAGINWARGRLNWTQMEPKRGQFAPSNNYDAAARELSKAEIQVLQVNHHSPPWAGAKSNRFPDDLHDAYRFYREMAQRWKGQVQAFEPWNEADWPMFGGHTGAEMASFQKACYWGLKAGNPDMIVCQNAFANYFPEVIADFHDNQAWPYFDTLNFHHYWSLDGLPKYYAQFREISGGRPIWVTECNFIRGLSAEGLTADAKTREFSAEGLRRQAAHVLQIFATSIQGGSAATFWFIFPNYAEGQAQFGVLRADLTPRPGYLALAAAGRLLADAKPVGRLKSTNKDFRGYLFRAKPDGKEQLVLVAWTTKDTTTIQLPATPVAVFDTIGREAHIERVGAAVDKAFPRAPKTRLMPCSQLIRELGRMADRGELPGVASRFELFADGGDHPSRFGAYALNVLVMAMLYNESPLAYPSDICPIDSQGRPVRGDVHRSIQVPEETATVIKRVVWDVLQTYPPAGMPPSLVIANRHLEPVIAGQPYTAKLKALHAAGPCVWSIVQGTLPQGLSLSQDGVLAGQSAAVGRYPLTIQLTDGKISCHRPLVLSVDQGEPPLIPDQPLETVSLDQRVLRQLKIEGGVGHITWSVSDGELPYGIMLSPAGMLVGSPGEEGEFTFKIKAEDAFPGGPRSAEKTFAWTIGPASPTALLLRRVVVTGKPDDKTVVIDGKPDEPFWKLDQAIGTKNILRESHEKHKTDPGHGCRADHGNVWAARAYRGGGRFGATQQSTPCEERSSSGHLGFAAGGGWQPGARHGRQ